MVQVLIAINLLLSSVLCWLIYRAIKLLEHMTATYHDLSLQDTRYMLQVLKENNHKHEKEL